MQTILGANGQIAEELARELQRNYPSPLRLVSRTPKKVHDSDLLHPANLLDAEATEKAIAGSETAYLTVGLPMDSAMWEEQFPIIMRNVIAGCQKHQAKLVFFDNTYMYAKDSRPQTEESPFQPVGPKSQVRAHIATMLLDEMKQQTIQALICRAPEFYGPGKTQSLTNTMVFDNIKRGQKPTLPLADSTLRTLIWTPDASRAMARLGNTPDAYGQTWHLPCDDHRLTYQQIIAQASKVCGREINYKILGMWVFKLGGLFKQPMKEIQELLPRYAVDNLFISTKFKQRFPDFQVTTYPEGIARCLERG